MLHRPPARQTWQLAQARLGAAPPVSLDQGTAAIAVFEFTGNWDRLGPGTARLTSFATPRDLAGKA